MLKGNLTENYYKNALVLAYLGDSVFSLIVRKFLVENYDFKAKELNKKANSVVCAKFQAQIMEQIKPTLTEDETDIVMRSRNAHTNNKAKNSTQEEYNLATQFEALLGYWYLNGEIEKINEVFKTYVEVNL